MASKYLQKFPIPAGFQQVLSDFTRQVLRDQPSNIIEYAAHYFQMLEKGKKLEFNSKYNVKKQDKKYQLAYNAKNAQQISKKAGMITQKLNKGPSVHESLPAGPSQPVSRHVIGTQKTVTGQQTSNYVNNLSNNIANQQLHQQQHQHQQQHEQQHQLQNQQQMIEEAISASVEKLFQQIDVDKNGYLQSKQIQRFVKLVAGQMGDFQFRQQDIGQFIAIVDNDRDGKISKEQLGDFVLSLFKAVETFGQQQQ